MLITPTIPLPKIDQLFFIVEFAGVFVGALGGAISAIRDSNHRYDIVGVLCLALVSALGGGITRDVMLQQGPPLALEDPRYLVTAFAGAVLAIALRRKLGRTADKAINVIDAAALGLFAVAGTTRALNAGLGRLTALLLGGVTAVGGGSWRDVFSGRPPQVFVYGQLYAIAALLGSATFLLFDHLHASRTASTVAGTLACFLLRMAAVLYDLRTSEVHARD